MKMLKSKNIRRICVLLAMLAPAAYLFGSLFSALTGAHGQQVFADDYSNDNSISLDIVLLPNSKFDSSGIIVEGIEGQYVCPVYFEYDDSYSYALDSVFTEGNYVYSLSFYDESKSLISVSSAITTNSPSVALSIDPCSFFRISFYFTTSHSFSLRVYGDSLIPAIDSVEYSDYVFGQFFDKDNFLVKIGQDVLSDDPHGFAPFALFWKYLDENMLHMGDMQLGLMGYGYVYYCCHVLLFDIGFILVTFFLDFIQKVNDKVVGGVD